MIILVIYFLFFFYKTFSKYFLYFSKNKIKHDIFSIIVRNKNEKIKHVFSRKMYTCIKYMYRIYVNTCIEYIMK